MATLTFKWDTSKIGLFRGQGLEKALTRALRMAGGDALRAAKTSARRKIRAERSLTATRIGKALSTRSPRAGSSIEELVWVLRISGRRVQANEFKYRQTKKGVSVAIRPGARTLIPGAFAVMAASTRANHAAVFTRRGPARNPTTRVATASLAEVLDESHGVPVVFERANEVFSSAFDRLLALELARATP